MGVISAIHMNEILKHIPKASGVYIMRDKDRKVLYIGKAINLNNRVKSYFQKDLPSPWIAIMVKQIKDIETIVVTNEFEALLLENNLIKKYHPQYNIRLKDDKTFPYLKLTNEEFPRIMVVRKVANDKAKYFGPYLSAYALRQSIYFIRKNFGIVTHTYKKGQRACLNYQIGLCSAPYAGKISKADYNDRVRSTIKFLQGDFKELLKELNTKMKVASMQEHFEEAAVLRDQIQNVTRLAEAQNIVSTKLVNRDVIAVYKIYDMAVCVIMKVRQGKLLGSNALFFEEIDGFGESEVLEAFISQHYLNNFDVGREILISHEVNNHNLIMDAFGEKGLKTKIVVPKTGEKMKLVELAMENAVTAANQKLSKSKKTMEILECLKNDLRLDKLPTRIEAYDISNLGSSSAVGAMVTFVNGIPHKDHYRKFIVKTVDGQNDFAMMAEVICRRFGNKELPKPDLMLIDGGTGQLSAVLKVLKDLKLKIPTIGLAKKYELIYIPGAQIPIALDYESKSLLLLRSIRDEVHRFVITFHRVRRGKDFINGS